MGRLTAPRPASRRLRARRGLLTGGGRGGSKFGFSPGVMLVHGWDFMASTGEGRTGSTKKGEGLKGRRQVARGRGGLK